MSGERQYVLVDPSLHDIAKLDALGRCCGRKPIVYKRSHGPGYPAGLFCHRCGRKYDANTGLQIENWAWKKIGDAFQSTQKRLIAPPASSGTGKEE